ncbi:hypothetical protein H1P_70032 [Hyella patelloides LEGE 07179]|uniref:Uncharacterized protein n=1 Tax=Hyella patelloides LEGE 07179 TaxID=945734 RepID=A0A563W366_9CYAN|nr:hypothetical protein H1P_70032 [Hyella patelloides LEGE 07179]
MEFGITKVSITQNPARGWKQLLDALTDDRIFKTKHPNVQTSAVI